MGAGTAAQARALLDTPQGATLLDLLGDPAARERLMATPTTPLPLAAMTGSMGLMLDRVLGDARQRIIDFGTQLRAFVRCLESETGTTIRLRSGWALTFIAGLELAGHGDVVLGQGVISRRSMSPRRPLGRRPERRGEASGDAIN